MALRKFSIASFALTAAIATQGCSLKPTKTDTATPRRYSAESTQGVSDLNFSAQAVVVDARPTFVRSLGFIPNSVQIRWDDFTQAEESAKGILQSDLPSLTRRLSQLGISPQTPVTVLGRGLAGAGEEGRVAWMLAYLGVNNVQFADINSVKGHLRFAKTDPGFSPSAQVEQYHDERERNAVEQADAATPRSKAAPDWEPQIDSSLLAARDELLFVIKNSGTAHPIAFTGASKLYKIIDTRSAAEYHNKSGLGVARAIPDMGAVNIEWKEFLTPQGRPKVSLRKKLESVGVKLENRIIVISNDGVSSGEVTMCLRAMGFNDSANYSGGLVDLMSAYPDR